MLHASQSIGSLNSSPLAMLEQKLVRRYQNLEKEYGKTVLQKLPLSYRVRTLEFSPLRNSSSILSLDKQTGRNFERHFIRNDTSERRFDPELNSSDFPSIASKYGKANKGVLEFAKQSSRLKNNIYDSTQKFKDPVDIRYSCVERQP